MPPKPIELKFALGGFNEVFAKQKALNKAIGEGVEASKQQKPIMGEMQELSKKQLALLDQGNIRRGENFQRLSDEKNTLMVSLALEKERLSVAKSRLHGLKEGTPEHRDALDLLNKQRITTDRMTRRYGDLRDRVKSIKDPLSKIISKTPLGILNKMIIGMAEFNLAFMVLGRQNVGRLITMQFAAMGKSVALFSRNLKAISALGMKKIFMGAALGLKAMWVSASGLLAAFAPFALIIAGVIAGIFLLKKMWDFNVGGMQTGFFSIMGDLQEIWGKFVANISKAMTKIGPLVKVMLLGPFFALKVLFAAIGAIFESVFVVLEPILDALGEIGRALVAPFQAFLPQGAKTIGIMELIGKTIGFVAKTIAVVLKIALLPVTLLAKGIQAIFDPTRKLGVVGKAVGIIFRLAFWPLILTFKLLKFGIDKIREGWQNMIAPVMKVWNWMKKIGQVVSDALNPFKMLQRMFDGMKLPGWLQKILDFFAGGGKAKEASEKAFKTEDPAQKATERATKLREVKATSLSPQTSIQNIWNRQSQATVNNNNNVTIQSSGAIDERQAPRIGDIVVATLANRNMMA